MKRCGQLLSVVVLSGTGVFAQTAAHLSAVQSAGAMSKTQPSASTNESADFASAPVRAAGAVQNLTFTFDASSTIGAPQVVTGGMSEQDFTDTLAGSCDTNGATHVYEPGDTCTVTVAFNPMLSGERKGAVLLASKDGKVLATAYIHGVGTGGARPSFTKPQQLVAKTNPQGIAVDEGGNLYVADALTGAVHFYSSRGGQYKQGDDVIAAGSLQQPYGMAIDGAGSIYVSDAALNVVAKYVPTGPTHTRVNDVASGLNHPQGIAVDGNGDVYVVESGNHAVLRFAPNSDGSYTRLQDVIDSGLQQPAGLAIDSAGTVYVSDAGSTTVHRYKPNGDGSYTQLTDVADGNTLGQPKGVAVNTAGDVFVSDSANSQVHKYSLNAAGVYAKTGDVGQGMGSPQSVTTDSKGSVFIADAGNSQVLKENGLTPLSSNTTYDWNKCISPNPVALSSPTATPQFFLIGGGANTSSDGNFCDLYDLALYPTNGSDSVGNNFQTFSTTTDTGKIPITLLYPSCNNVTDPAAGSGGCLPNGGGTTNTYYELQLNAPTSETSDSVTVYMDPTASGFSTQPVTISFTINPSSVAATTTSISVSPNPAMLDQVVTLTATVTSAGTVSGGTVAFLFNGVTILGCGTVAVNGAPVTCHVTFGSTGSFTIQANYSGTSSFASSSSSAYTEQVNSTVTATTAISSKALTQNYNSGAFTPITGGGGTGTFTYSISPALPMGLSFNTMTGTISGAASVTLAQTTFTVTVKDSSNATASNTFLLTVNAALTANQAIPSFIATEDQASTNFFPVQGSGGTGTKTYSISPTLPTGLSMSNAGVISGSPTGTLTATTFTVIVTDANNATASNTFSLTVNTVVSASQAIPSVTLTQNHMTASFSPMIGSGGTSPLAYSISPALPSGLTLNVLTGAITGTPAVSLAATTFSITVTDRNNESAAATFVLKVNSSPTATQSVEPTTLTENHAAAFTPVTGGGGTAPLAYTVLPSLPSGLTMSGSTGAITGSPTATLVPTTFTVTITDANNATAANTFIMAVNSPPTATQAVASTTLTQNHAASFTPVTGGGGAGPLMYSISPALPGGLSISTSTGAITGTPMTSFTGAQFMVTVTDQNDATAANTFLLSVSLPVTTSQIVTSKTLTQGHATGFTPTLSSGGTGALSYGISPVLPNGLNFNSSTGSISGASSVTLAATNFTVTATDQNGATASSTFSLSVAAALTAVQSLPAVSLTQNHAVTNSTPITGNGGAGPLVYSISPTLPTGLVVSSGTGAIIGASSFTLAATLFTVTVTDQNGATASNTFTLTINGAVTASQTPGSEVLTQNHTASFTPIAGGGGTAPLSYSISPMLPAGLIINPGTGVVSGAPLATLAATTFSVTVTDANGATASNTFALTVNTTVTATTSVASLMLTKNQGPTNVTPVTGAGGTGTLMYSISPALLTGLSFNTATGAVTGTATVTGASTYTVTVTDQNGSIASSSFSLTVNTPPVATQAVATKTLTQGHASTSFTPVTGSGGSPSLMYSVAPLLPTGLSMSTATGAITGVPSSALAATTFTVTVTDANNATASATFSLAVSAAVTAAQAVASKTLTQNRAATSFTPVTGANGTGTLTYSVSPMLPAGLNFSSAGVVSGTPTATSAAMTYTVTVTDTNGATATATFSLGVNSAVTTAVAVTQAFLTKGFIIDPFVPISGSGGTAPLMYSITPALPAGLSISSSTGAVSGTPSVTSSATTYTVTVTDANGETATNTFQLTVSGPVSATTVIPSVGLTVESAVNGLTPVTGSGGTGALHYSVSPTLPPGIAMNPATGTISGLATITTGAATYTVTVTDANGATASATFSLSVNGPVTASTAISSKTLTKGQPSTSFTPVTGNGGTTPLSYSVSPGLPSGLGLSSATGAVIGSPMATSAATSYTVTVTDANGATATAHFSLAVNAAVTATQSVATTVLTQNHAATSFTPVTGGGGTGALAYSISPALPTGLSLSTSSGTISGTPMVALAVTPFTVTVTDTNGATATNTFSLTVNGAVTATQSVATTVLTQNHLATSFTPVTGSGGTGTLAYSISTALPTGLNFNTSNGAITGTPTVTSSATAYTITVTDANGATASASFSLMVDSAVVATQSVASTTLTQNHAATPFTPVTGSGGDGALSYGISPSLPAGLSLSASTGVVSGTPSVASAMTSYVVTVTDINGATATASFSLGVNSAVTATTAVATTLLTQNHAATTFTPVTGGGGTTPLTYSVSPSLPAGLNFSTSNGAVSGTPTAISAATTYTVTVSDKNGATATATFALTVDAAVTATTSVANEALTYNAPANFTPVTGGGGTGALSYSISPVLPAGLSLSSSTGAITGATSVIIAATTYTVTVTDTDSATASATFVLSVNKAASAVALVASASNITPIQQVTLTATVTDGTTGSTGTPTGSVSFFDGPTLLQTKALMNGVASYTTSLSPGITHTITATYSGDGDFQAGTAPAGVSVTAAPLDFAAAPINLPQPLYVVPGHSVSFSFGVTPQYGMFPADVTYTLTGLPNGATYTFNPSSLPASSTGATITGIINVPATIASNSSHETRYAPLLAGLLLLPLAGFKRSRKKLGTLMILLLTGGIITTMTGCGGAGDGILQQKEITSQVTLTITSGSISHSVPFTLVVE